MMAPSNRRTRTRAHRFAALLAGTAVGLLAAGAASALSAAPAGADPGSPTPSTDATVTKAGTSFLTAVPVQAGQPVKVPASTGDYLYWAFTATAGQTSVVAVTVTLPPATSRHGAATWTVEVFDGLRRRQACTDGTQAPQAGAADATVALGCTLREVRAWAEPWSGDPLPGTYYVKLAATDLPETDLGLPVDVDLSISTRDSGDPVPEGGDLRAPLVPATTPGKVLPATPTLAAEEDGDWLPDLPERSSRWAWTAAGGVLAALGGIAGYSLTRRRRVFGAVPVGPGTVGPGTVGPGTVGPGTVIAPRSGSDLRDQVGNR